MRMTLSDFTNADTNEPISIDPELVYKIEKCTEDDSTYIYLDVDDGDERLQHVTESYANVKMTLMSAYERLKE